MNVGLFQMNPVLIRGVLYPSQRAAAKALGLHERTIGKALEHGKIDQVGLGLKLGGAPRKPCRYMGGMYPSIGAAARACGVSTATVSRAIRRQANG